MRSCLDVSEGSSFGGKHGGYLAIRKPQSIPIQKFLPPFQDSSRPGDEFLWVALGEVFFVKFSNVLNNNVKARGLVRSIKKCEPLEHFVCDADVPLTERQGA